MTRPENKLVAVIAVTLAMHLYPTNALGQQTDDQSVLSASNLISIAEKLRSFRPKDLFDAPPVESSLIGRTIVATIKPTPVGGGLFASCTGLPRWTYVAINSDYQVSFHRSSMLLSGNNSFSGVYQDRARTPHFGLTYLSLSCKTEKTDHYVTQNEYGAEIDVTHHKETIVAVSNSTDPNAWYNPRAMLKSYWSTTIAGDAARQLSKAVAIRVRGTVGQWPNGQNVICGAHQRPNIIDSARVTTDACVYKVDSMVVEVIDERTGEVLYVETNRGQNQ